VKDIHNTFKEKLYECKKHIEKIEDAKEYLQDKIPIDVESYQQIDKITSSFIDQLIYRFLKLQDTIGESIFKSILILSHEDVKKMTFIDILNRFEELELLDKTLWLSLRELRNDIAHEYSFNQEEVVDNINLIYSKSSLLIDTFKVLENYIEDKFEV